MAIQSYQKVLAPIDGSKQTPIVMKRAIQAALHNDAHLDILNVVQINQVTEGFASLTDLSDGKTHELVQIVEKRLRDLEKQAQDAGVKSVNIHIRFGSPKLVISRDFLRDHHNDLIVMGGTGASRIERLLLGSTTGYVVRMAPCDVIVARQKNVRK
ncbi:universal stress protein [Limosilactobacillus caecicola]|uniref:universal stress protein n=1 Tax=Limosilactobacillus caecicola TaxID=2941332 RepID=UPI00203FFC77|nr:universal stress protein [Limosilactobacillus caecicola]